MDETQRKTSAGIFLGPEGIEIPRPRWTGGGYLEKMDQTVGRSEFLERWIGLLGDQFSAEKHRHDLGRGNRERAQRIPGSPQHHGVPQGAHGQVHESVLVQVQLPVDAASKIHQARSEVGGRDPLERNGNNPGWIPAGASLSAKGLPGWLHLAAENSPFQVVVLNIIFQGMRAVSLWRHHPRFYWIYPAYLIFI